MRVFAIPTATAAATAGLSVLFFTGLSHAYGDAMLGRIILVQAAAAIAVIALTPQTWAYMVGSVGQSQLEERYRNALSIEVCGMTLGALVLVLAAQLPIAVFRDYREAAFVFYLSLAIQSFGSCMGWLRARENWTRYVLWVIGPNLVRMPLVWAAPPLAGRGWLPDFSHDPMRIILVFFLIPDLVRLVAIALPIAIRHYRLPSFGALVAAVPAVGRNWIYDIGSQITDSADKLVVGHILGPQLLTVYFFARRLGAIVTMATEPFYIEHYRRVVARPRNEQLLAARRVYRMGGVLALTMFVGIAVGVAVVIHIPPLAMIVPRTVLASIPLFLGIMLFECITAASRWSRFASQIMALSTRLFLLRIALFAMFAVNVWLYGSVASGLGVIGAFAMSSLAEAAFLRFNLLGRTRLPAAVRGGADEISEEAAIDRTQT